MDKIRYIDQQMKLYRECLNVLQLDSGPVSQHKHGPRTIQYKHTHTHTHTPDLVLSSGLSISSVFVSPHQLAIASVSVQYGRSQMQDRGRDGYTWIEMDVFCVVVFHRMGQYKG
jgi:hypothetical protein